MTLDDLRDLVDQTSELDGETEVKLAHQPSWPFEYSIGDYHIITREDDTEEVFFEEGSQLGYLPSDVAEEIGW